MECQIGDSSCNKINSHNLFTEISNKTLHTDTRCHFSPLEFFTISRQYKNANIANFVLAVSFKIEKNYKVCKLER